MRCCVVTGTRAEYGLLYWLMKGIQTDNILSLQVVVTGMHLSPEFGLTFKEVENEFDIDEKIETVLSSDTSIGLSKSMGLGQISFAECYERLKPDLIIVLGDRYEIFSAVSAAMVSRIPVAHLHGGEATEGLIDESIRHSITKMSHLHFTATEEYRKRVIQLGEQPNNVFNVGGMGIDNIKKLPLLGRKKFQEVIDFSLGEKTFLITFHPVTLEKSTAKTQIINLLMALEEFDNCNYIFTKANSDTDGRIINQMIDDFADKHRDRSVTFFSMGQLRYLSALKYVDVVIGNSSSGLSEVPTFKIPTINIGDRQKGRMKASSVIDCSNGKKEIVEAINKALSSDFQKELINTKNPYGTGGASKKIIEIIKEVDFNNILKKKFYDLKL
jgi:GDP/UDP-N,N'-diacetylbacillosamine 2-epimerase (hydrolysing)